MEGEKSAANKRQLDIHEYSDHVGKVRKLTTEPDKSTLEVPLPVSSDIHGAGINTTQPNSAITGSFLSREEELAKLTSATENQERKHLIDVAITGMPGIGKTQLVHKFIKDNTPKFYNVIWIQAETETEVITAFLNLAKHLNIISKNSNLKHTGTYLMCFISNIYQVLNETKTVIIFDNVFIDVHKFLPPVGVKTNNVTIIITSQFSEWQCNLHIPLQCFSPDVSEQFLVQNLENCSHESAQKLAQAFDHLPLALQNLVSYFNDTKEIVSMCDKKFTIDHLIIQAVDCSIQVRYKIKDGYHYSFGPENICKFTSTSLSTDRIGIMSMCELTFTYISNLPYGALAMKLLQLMAYLISDSINVSLFLKIEDIEDKQDVNKAFLLLRKLSLVKIDAKNITISKVIQYIIRNIHEKESLLRELLLCFQNNLEYSRKGKVPYIAFIFRPHLMKIYKEQKNINRKILQEFDVLFMAGSCIGTRLEVIENMTQVYNHILYDGCDDGDNDIKFHCIYVNMLCIKKSFDLAHKTCDKIIEKQVNGIRDLIDSFYGLQLLYSKSSALYNLNKLNQAWIICKAIHIFISKQYTNTKFIWREEATSSLTLLIQISCRIAELKSYHNLQICLNILDNFIENFEWINNGIHFECDEIEMIGILIDYYIKTNQPSVAINWITNVTNKLVKKYEHLRQDDDDDDGFKSTDLHNFLKYSISRCLVELNEIQKAWEIIKDINIGYSIEVILTLCKVTVRLDKTCKLPTLKYCIAKLESLLDEFYSFIKFDQMIECIQILEKELKNHGMESKVLELYDRVEKGIKYSYATEEFAILSSRVQLFKAMYMYEHIDQCEALQTLAKISKLFKLNTNGENCILIKLSLQTFKDCEKVLADKYNELQI